MEFQSFTDQMNRNVMIPSRPGRIISLVPSQTELLADLGLDHELVGITKFCVHPAGLRKHKTIIGGTKKFNFNVIEKLDPQLIIGNKEENYEEGIIQLEKNYPVWMSDIVQFTDALEMIHALGEITGKSECAEQIIEKIQNNFSVLKPIDPASVLYLIWRRPWMGAGSQTFIDSILTKIGLNNCLQHVNRYLVLTDTDIAELRPELILLSSEPYPFGSKHIHEIKMISPQSNVMLVDGEMFSWYGSRLIHAPAYLSNLTWPQNSFRNQKL